MNKNFFFISKPAFDELCKYVCYQIQPSGSEQIDRETLNFAIYWQICILLEEEVKFIPKINSRIHSYQQLLQDKIDSQKSGLFDVSEVIESNISELLQNYYPKSGKNNIYQTDSFESWIENLTRL